ncbi:hypothetical protein YC2023_030659 [Brassica napus]
MQILSLFNTVNFRQEESTSNLVVITYDRHATVLIAKNSNLAPTSVDLDS